MHLRALVAYGSLPYQGVVGATCHMATDRRKISFPADSVLTSVVQDGDAVELIKLLDPPGTVDVNQRNHVGLTALHHGVLHNNLDAVKVLLCQGADTNAQDVYGFTPLHTAAACGFLHIASLLILFGADVLLQTKEEEMPVDVAKDIEIVRLLTEVMYPRLHKEVYYSSLAKTTLIEVTRIMKCFSEYVIRTCVELVQNVRKQNHKPVDNGESPCKESSENHSHQD